MYEQDRRDTDMGRDLDEKTAVAPRRRYEASRRAAEPDQAEETPRAPVPEPVSPRPPRRHRYAEETTPVTPKIAEAVTAAAQAPVPQLAPEPEVDRAQLNRIAQFFRGAEDEKAKDKPRKPDPAPTPPAREGSSVWNTQATQELKPYMAERTGETRVNGSGQVEDDEAVLIAVRELSGVHDAELYTDPTGARRLRLDLDTAADPDAVSAKATRLLADRLGVRAQPRTTQAYAFPRPPSGVQTRAVVEQVQVSTSGFETTVEVGLNVEGHRAIGRATGPAVDWHVLRTAADATIDAVATLLGDRGRCVVEHASVVPAGALRVAVVVVLMLTEAGAEQLAGAAPVAGDNRQAMVHATMSALNRRLEVLLP
ncbi:hypothetical protein AB0I28_31070 [Phytomonospora sp. NPDC050363]|uniref:hypothetical protein n=1 Tax=Phytomonospora sp. NPDC050363 TaxID=3155642 RepID=UPI0033D505FF